MIDTKDTTTEALKRELEQISRERPDSRYVRFFSELPVRWEGVFKKLSSLSDKKREG